MLILENVKRNYISLQHAIWKTAVISKLVRAVNIAHFIALGLKWNDFSCWDFVNCLNWENKEHLIFAAVTWSFYVVRKFIMISFVTSALYDGVILFSMSSLYNFLCMHVSDLVSLSDLLQCKLHVASWALTRERAMFIFRPPPRKTYTS